VRHNQEPDLSGMMVVVVTVGVLSVARDRIRVSISSLGAGERALRSDATLVS
jgi:hypothetical protein